MRRAQLGDQAAYRLLLDDLQEATTLYLNRILFDGQAVEDCVQECLLALHRARATYDPRRPFNPWYFTIVRHRARDVIRRRQPAAAETLSDQADAAAPYTLQVEARRDLDRLLSQIRPVYREALELTKLEGLTIKEAADKVGVATGTMKARVHRGLAHLMRVVHAESAKS